MRILVTGASGFIGRAFLSSAANDENCILRAALRTKIDNLPTDVEKSFVKGLDADSDWRESLVNCDVILHAASLVHMLPDPSTSNPMDEFRRINVEGTLNLAQQAVRMGVKRFVFISSIKVNGEKTSIDKPYTADDIPAPVDPYGISKYEAEQGLLKLMAETGLEVVIIRPPLVYGPGVKANFFRLLQLTEKNIPLPLGLIHNRRSMIYVNNLVSAMITCSKHSRAAGEIFLVSDNEDISTPELIKKLSTSFGNTPTLLPIPVGLLKISAAIAGKKSEIERLTGSLCVDSGKINTILDWYPPYTLDHGIQETVTQYMKRD